MAKSFPSDIPAALRITWRGVGGREGMFCSHLGQEVNLCMKTQSSYRNYKGAAISPLIRVQQIKSTHYLYFFGQANLAHYR